MAWSRAMPRARSSETKPRRWWRNSATVVEVTRALKRARAEGFSSSRPTRSWAALPSPTPGRNMGSVRDCWCTA